MQRTHAILAAAVFILGSAVSRADDLQLPPIKPLSVSDIAPISPCGSPGPACYPPDSKWRHWREWLLPRPRHSAPRCDTCCDSCRRSYILDRLLNRTCCGAPGCRTCDGPPFRQQFWEWLTYQPHYCPCCCRWSTNCCCDPPLYMYFLCTDGCAHFRPCPQCPPPPGNTGARIGESNSHDFQGTPEKHDPFKREALEPKGLMP
jgi:hypothetical protein